MEANDVKVGVVFIHSLHLLIAMIICSLRLLSYKCVVVDGCQHLANPQQPTIDGGV